MYILNFSDFINEAFKPIDISDFSKILYENKDSILNIVSKKNPKTLIGFLNKIFKNKLKQSEKTIISINDSVNQIINEIQRIENKITKYPQIKKYLKQEIRDEQTFIRFLKNKNKQFINISFILYDTFYQLEKKNLVGKIFHKIEKFLTPNLFHYEYTKKDYIEELKKYDLGISSAFFNIATNNIAFIIKENIVKKLNNDNFDQFVKILEATLIHEATHMRDFLNKDVKQMRDNSGYVDYLEENTEIKAYAESIIYQLKSNNFSNSEIEEILLEPDKNLLKLKASDDLKNYYSLYYKNNKMVYYRIVSECLDVLNQEYENENIK